MQVEMKVVEKVGHWEVYLVEMKVDMMVFLTAVQMVITLVVELEWLSEHD
jgi:hypothetical protein